MGLDVEGKLHHLPFLASGAAIIRQIVLFDSPALITHEFLSFICFASLTPYNVSHLAEIGGGSNETKCYEDKTLFYDIS